MLKALQSRQPSRRGPATSAEGRNLTIDFASGQNALGPLTSTSARRDRPHRVMRPLRNLSAI